MKGKLTEYNYHHIFYQLNTIITISSHPTSAFRGFCGGQGLFFETEGEHAHEQGWEQGRQREREKERILSRFYRAQSLDPEITTCAAIKSRTLN